MGRLSTTSKICGHAHQRTSLTVSCTNLLNLVLFKQFVFTLSSQVGASIIFLHFKHSVIDFGLWEQLVVSVHSIPLPLTDSCCCCQVGHKKGPGGKSYWFSWDSDEALLRNARWNWFTARNYCRMRCMDLITLESERELNFIGENMAAGGVREVSRWWCCWCC